MLILGSLPGQASLQARQYYAQSRNAFWRIVADLYDTPRDLPYARRAGALVAHRIALWDVCASARRPGSLDAAIDLSTVRPNAFAAFFAAHARLTHVFFNGAKAADLYRRLVLPGLPSGLTLVYETLPSTSPAHAGMPYAAKLARWQTVREAATSSAAAASGAFVTTACRDRR